MSLIELKKCDSWIFERMRMHIIIVIYISIVDAPQ